MRTYLFIASKKLRHLFSSLLVIFFLPIRCNPFHIFCHSHCNLYFNFIFITHRQYAFKLIFVENTFRLFLRSTPATIFPYSARSKNTDFCALGFGCVLENAIFLLPTPSKRVCMYKILLPSDPY